MSEPLEISVHVEEKRYQPTQEKTVVPDWEPVEVTPDSGYALSKVTVEGMPEPTETETFTENGEYNVGRIGTAIVDVDIDLQDKTVTPTEQTQTVEADSGYDGLDTVTVNPIPPEYVVPSGSVDITANGQVSVSGKATANVNVPQGVFPTGTKQISITQNGTTTEDVSAYAEAEITVSVPEYDDGGWGREVGAPNLDLLRLPGRECASGSEHEVAFFSFKIDYPYPDGISTRIDCGVPNNIKEISINKDGTYSVVQDIPINGSYFNISLFSVGWHAIRFEYSSSPAEISFYEGNGYDPISSIIYESYTHLTRLRSLSFGRHVVLVDSYPQSGGLNLGNNKLVKIDFINCNFSKITSISSIFRNSPLYAIDLHDLDFSSATNISEIGNGNMGVQYVNYSGIKTGSISNSITLTSYLRTPLVDLRFDFCGVNFSTTQCRFQRIMFDSDCQCGSFTFGSESNTLREIIGFPHANDNVTLSGSSNLTVESLMTVINALNTVQTTKTLSLGVTNISKLTADQIAIAQDKGWTVT